MLRFTVWFGFTRLFWSSSTWACMHGVVGVCGICVVWDDDIRNEQVWDDDIRYEQETKKLQSCGGEWDATKGRKEGRKGHTTVTAAYHFFRCTNGLHEQFFAVSEFFNRRCLQQERDWHVHRLCVHFAQLGKISTKKEKRGCVRNSHKQPGQINTIALATAESVNCGSPTAP